MQWSMDYFLHIPLILSACQANGVYLFPSLDDIYMNSYRIVIELAEYLSHAIVTDCIVLG